MEQLRIAIYVRVSTREQAEEGYSIGAQLEKLRQYCDIREWIVQEEYVDAGFSGAKLERPAIQKIIRDCVKKKFDMVLVYKLDRLSRSQKDTLYLIEDVFHPNGVKFASIQENFDTSTAFGMAMVGILSVFAQLERSQIAERMAMGRESRALDGLWHGGGHDPIGYDYIKSTGEKGGGRLVINEYEAMQVRKVYDLFESGCSINEIKNFMHSKYTNKHGSWHSHSSIYSVLETPLICGMIKTKNGYIEAQHEAIIPFERFESVQELMKKRRANRTNGQKNPFKRTSLLGGLLFCGNCGARYYTKTINSGRKAESKKLIPYYTCYSRGKSSKDMIMDPDCKNINIRQDRLDQMIIDQICQLQLKPEQVDDIPEYIDESETIKKRIKELENQKNKLIDLYMLNTFSLDELQDRSSKIDAELEALEAELLVDYEPEISIEEAKLKLNFAREIFENGSFEEQSALIRELIEQVIIYDDKLEIHWTFE